VEISALRLLELDPLVEALDTLDLSSFAYVSIHAPSSFSPEQEPSVVTSLKKLIPRKWPIILHPDAASQLENWASFGDALFIENMDKRKPLGRNVRELAGVFRILPRASLCLDLAHARQFDPSMTETVLILREFGDRIRQLHISEVGTSSRHAKLSHGAILAFQEIAHLIPPGIPVILESQVDELEIEAEVLRACEALSAQQGNNEHKVVWRETPNPGLDP
jgi:hypothetical protein